MDSTDSTYLLDIQQKKKVKKREHFLLQSVLLTSVGGVTAGEQIAQITATQSILSGGAYIQGFDVNLNPLSISYYENL